MADEAGDAVAPVHHLQLLNSQQLLQQQPCRLRLFPLGEMAGIKVKSRLENLMGSDVVQLNDRTYMLKLQEQLSREYELQMDRWEGVREEREKRRQRRLYIDGLQDKPNMDGKSSRIAASSSAPTSALRSKDASPDARTPLSSGQRLAPGRGADHWPPVRCSTAPSGAAHEGQRHVGDVRPSPQQHLLMSSGCQNPCTLSLTSRTATLKRSAEKSKSAAAGADELGQNAKAKPNGAAQHDAAAAAAGRDADGQLSATDLAQTKSPRASLLRQLRHEQTVRGLYKTADALLKRPPLPPSYPTIVQTSD